ncbi:hypothetical protein Hanom_Chr06g00486521 [Helianthus anomalus]
MLWVEQWFYDSGSSINFLYILAQIVGTSNNFVKKKHLTLAISDSEDSYSSNSRNGRKNNNIRVNSFTPSTPPPTAGSFRTAKRRKGIPHRAPMGGLVIEY